MGWIDQLPAAEREQVRSHIQPQTWEEVRAASPLAWIDMRQHLEVDAALLTALGSERYRRGCAELTLRLTQRPLFAPITSGRLVQGHPERLLRRLPLAWSLVFRNVGDAQVEEIPHGLTIELRNLPTLVRHDEAFLLGFLGTLEGVGAACGVDLDVAVDASRRGLGLVRLTLGWTVSQFHARPG